MDKKQKAVVTRKELIEMGYPRRMIDELKWSDDLDRFGFVHGKTLYVYPEKLEQYLLGKEL